MTAPSKSATCGLCGEPMPPGEETFVYHGYSGPCPKPPLNVYRGKHLNTAGGYHAQACPCGNSGYRIEDKPGREVEDAAA